MNSHFFRDLVDKFTGVARDSCEDLKSAAQDNIVDPLRDASRRVSKVARDKFDDAASYTRRTAEKSGEWASDHMAVAGTLMLGVGIITGFFLYSKMRR